METESESGKESSSPHVPDYDVDDINIGEDVSTEYFEEETLLASSGGSAPSEWAHSECVGNKKLLLLVINNMLHPIYR